MPPRCSLDISSSTDGISRRIRPPSSQPHRPWGEHPSATLLEMASDELESMRPHNPPSGGDGSCPLRPFPLACLYLLREIGGNGACVDCGEADPQWASVTYGALLCLRCCGRHRGLGVEKSFVRSVTMDSWSHSQILSMLEGGNDQLGRFFDRHGLRRRKPEDGNTTTERYRTGAARFYRHHLAEHVNNVSKMGLYLGREANRAGAHKSRVAPSLSKKQGDARKKETKDCVQQREELSVEGLRH
mmetsp:Transcript_26840/g.54948  ORF Transcript_26840/g.54948 Transcript_26840/m.54948 type:complete len:244 (-) Transcript_26840:478-1209(-)